MKNNIKAVTLGHIHNDLFFDKKVSISFDTLEYNDTSDYKVLVQIEPPSIINIIDNISQNKNNFDLILTWNPKLLDECNNSRLFPFGSCWINESDRKIHKKTKKLSIISSNKTQTFGHKLRHDIINNARNSMDVFGSGYLHIDNKITGLKDYMFSLIIENDRLDNWFTEKIVDCLVTGTIPIYWGCNNIDKYFNTKGFIEFKNINHFKESVLPILNEDTYKNMLPFINENFNLALNYVNFWGRVESIIKEELKKI